MIKKIQPLNLAEVKEIVKDLDNKELQDYFKKFGKLQKNDSEKLDRELKEIGNVKIKDEYRIKIIDFLPKTQEELNKIFTDVSLDEKEASEILSIVGKY